MQDQDYVKPRPKTMVLYARASKIGCLGSCYKNSVDPKQRDWIGALNITDNDFVNVYYFTFSGWQDQSKIISKKLN